MLDAALDVFRLRQYFGVATRTRELGGDLLHDLSFLDTCRRAVFPGPFGAPRRAGADRLPVFGAPEPLTPRPPLAGRRVALVATGGSGALASLVGVARALEEAAITPSVISVCSGSALFGFPLAAGIPAGEVADFTASLRPDDYIDVDWSKLLRLPLEQARGFAGILRGDKLEAAYRRLLGNRTLGGLPIPAYAPIWNVEENRVEYLGSTTYPEVPVAAAVRMAVALPLFIQPVVLEGDHWYDGGVVDIFPVHPVLDLQAPPDVAIAVNGFYPPEFAGEDMTGWEERRWSILYAASQVRTAQQAQLARENLARLRASAEVVMLEPVPYSTVRGLGFYRQFLDTHDWPDFMRAGRDATRAALSCRRAPAATSSTLVRSHQRS